MTGMEIDNSINSITAEGYFLIKPTPLFWNKQGVDETYWEEIMGAQLGVPYGHMGYYLPTPLAGGQRKIICGAN